MKFDLPKEQSSIIKVIGVGGGGSNAVNHMYNQGITGVDFIICNTDAQALEQSPIPNKVQLGATLTEGLGAGANPEVGKNAAIENVEELREMLEKNTQMVFITAGMGGGTGTGAAPIIAQTAREMGILTVGIVTVPFSFEGRRRKQQADHGLEELRANVDTLLVICNDKLREMHGNLKIAEAFSKADDILTTAAKGIAEIITVVGYINVDFEDVKTVMKDGGTAIMGSASVEGEDRATKAVSQALASPLLNDNDITGANYILLNITSGEEEVTMDEVEEITDYIQDESGQTADIIWGTGHDDKLGNKVSVTIIATGFGTNKPTGFQEAEEPKRNVISLDAEVETNITQPMHEDKKLEDKVEPEVKPEEPFLKTAENQKSFEFQVRNASPKPQIEPQKESQPEIKKFNLDDEITSELNSEIIEVKDEVTEEEIQLISKPNSQMPRPVLEEEEQIRKSQDRLLKLKALSLKMKSPGGINDLEKEPAYKRRNITLDETPHSSESNVSRYTLSEDEENKTSLKQNNSFLHDNVD